MSSNNLDGNPPVIGRNIQNLKSENIVTVPENPTMASIVSETQSDEKIHSGESLFKTFVFNQCATGAEIDKCKTFWETVMKNKLEPIKCSIIQREKKAKIPTEDSNNCKEEIDKAIERVHLQYRQLWSNMLQEVKRRKLDELKFLGKRKCMFCSRLYPAKCHSYKQNEASEIKEDIKKLNCWKSSSIDQICEVDVADEDTVESITECAGNIPHEETNIPSIPTSKYKFVNIINEKKRNNCYSRWREQSTECYCGQKNCSCKNHQYISIIKPSVPSEDEISLKVDCETEKEKNLVDHVNVNRNQSQVHFSSMLVTTIEENEVESLSDVALQREQEMEEASSLKSKDETHVSSIDEEKHSLFKEVDEKLYLTPSHEKPASRRGMSILKLPSLAIQNIIKENSKKEVQQEAGPPVASLIRKDSIQVTRERKASHDVQQLVGLRVPTASLIRRDSLEVARETPSEIAFEQFTGPPIPIASVIRKDSIEVTKERQASRVNVQQFAGSSVPIASLRKDSLEIARETPSKIEVQQFTGPPVPIASLIRKDSLEVARERTPSRIKVKSNAGTSSAFEWRNS